MTGGTSNVTQRQRSRRRRSSARVDCVPWCPSIGPIPSGPSVAPPPSPGVIVPVIRDSTSIAWPSSARCRSGGAGEYGTDHDTCEPAGTDCAGRPGVPDPDHGLHPPCPLGSGDEQGRRRATERPHHRAVARAAPGGRRQRRREVVRRGARSRPLRPRSRHRLRRAPAPGREVRRGVDQGTLTAHRVDRAGGRRPRPSGARRPGRAPHSKPGRPTSPRSASTTPGWSSKAVILRCSCGIPTASPLSWWRPERSAPRGEPTEPRLLGAGRLRLQQGLGADCSRSQAMSPSASSKTISWSVSIT